MFCFSNGIYFSCQDLLTSTFGNEAISKTNIYSYHWFNEFKYADVRSRTNSVVVPGNIEAVPKSTMQDRHMTYQLERPTENVRHKAHKLECS